MSAIRPLEPGDLEAVARLYEQVARSGGRSPPPELAAEFERTTLDHPWADPELPSLVYEDQGKGIVGFIGSHPRRLRLGDRELRLGCSGQLVAHPDFRRKGIGALLLRRYLAGPQDLTITDGATDTVRAIWEALGGRTNTLASIGWVRVLRPASYAVARLAARRGRVRTAGALLGLADRIVGRPLAPPEPEGSSEPLEAEALIDGLESLQGDFRLRPAYDPKFLGWLFAELAAVRSRGELVRRFVRAADGRPAGWYLAYILEGGNSEVLQVASTPEDAALVLDQLIGHAHERGSAAVQGRVEPHLYAALRKRRCLFQRTEWALVHSRDADVRATLACGRALLTRLEGEWWMGHHLA